MKIKIKNKDYLIEITGNTLEARRWEKIAKRFLSEFPNWLEIAMNAYAAQTINKPFCHMTFKCEGKECNEDHRCFLQMGHVGPHEGPVIVASQHAN